MAEKRRRESDHYGKAMFRTEPKKPKHNQHHTHTSPGRGRDNRNGNGNSTHQPPTSEKFTADEMQKGMITLLGEFIDMQSESTPDSADILHHARALRRLLSARANAALPSKTKRELDAARPDGKAYVNVPPYMTKIIKDSAELPPIPPITEPSLEEAVFTHVSLKHAFQPKGFNADSFTYEQLELVGDSYLGLMSTRIVSSRFSHLETGKQSAFKQDLVNNETLSKLSAKYGLGERLQHKLDLDSMMDKKGWVKIQADVFEAYVAAIILSDPAHGFDTAESWMTELWAPMLLAYRPPLLENPDAKNEMARQLGGKNVKLEYKETKPMVHINGVQRYVMGVYLTGWGYTGELLGTAEGQNKGQAGTNAAQDALKKRGVVFEEACRRKKEFYAEKEREKAEAEEVGGGGGGVKDTGAKEGKRKAEDDDVASPKKVRVENEYGGNVKKKRKADEGRKGGDMGGERDGEGEEQRRRKRERVGV